MEYEFSWGAFLLGMIITIASVLVLRFYQPIADNLASGMSSYERMKLAGLIGIVAGIIIMLNLHLLIMFAILNLFF